MVNFRIVARAISQVLIFEGFFLLLTAGVSLITGERQTAATFLYSAVITIVTGVLVFTPLRNTEKTYGTREGYIILLSIFLIFSLFGTLPYILGRFTHSFADAFFESVSGFTTTNATIFHDVETLPRGILLWRSLTQWIGGFITISLSLYVLPIVKYLNIQLPTYEFSGQTADKILPKTVDITKSLVKVYLSLTFIEAMLLTIGKMPLFDSICHSMSTMSTGGLSTRNDGIAAYPSPYLKTVITLFMFLAATNISLFYFAARRNYGKILQNNEFRIYTAIVLAISALVSLVLFIQSGTGLGKAISEGFFHVISIVSTTGFFTSDYNLWGNFLILILIILMFSGGMTGSASGGIKIIRLSIITLNSRNVIKRLVHPNAFLKVRIDRRTVTDNIVINLLVFTAIYLIAVSVGTLVISLMDYDILTSLTTTVSLIGNIGPGVGSFGPFSDFAEMTTSGKFFLSGLMLAGRLELLAVIIFFSRTFYKK
ncbi:MAG: TrkH family potassium uptake protein [Bacteroidales bacterium]|nr:TrkH family potassium uptake protein [Bacteroidales bacterium]